MSADYNPFSATNIISEQELDNIARSPRKKIMLPDYTAAILSQRQDLDPVKTRQYLESIQSNQAGLAYANTTTTHNQSIMEALSPEDRQMLIKRNIEIGIKVKDMPSLINILGDHISITCDYTNGAKPAIGENVTFFSNTMIRYRGIKPSEAKAGLYHTKIEDNVIIGYGVNVNSFNTIIRNNATVESYHTAGTNEFIIGENSHIRVSWINKDPGIMRASRFYNIGPNNEIGRNSEVKGNVVFTGHNNISPFSKISDNVPLMFSDVNLLLLSNKIPYE